MTCVPGGKLQIDFAQIDFKMLRNPGCLSCPKLIKPKPWVKMRGQLKTVDMEWLHPAATASSCSFFVRDYVSWPQSLFVQACSLSSQLHRTTERETPRPQRPKPTTRSTGNLGSVTIKTIKVQIDNFPFFQMPAVLKWIQIKNSSNSNWKCHKLGKKSPHGAKVQSNSTLRGTCRKPSCASSGSSVTRNGTERNRFVLKIPSLWYLDIPQWLIQLRENRYDAPSDVLDKLWFIYLTQLTTIIVAWESSPSKERSVPESCKDPKDTLSLLSPAEKNCLAFSSSV